MRADKHYVEMLDAPPARPAATPQADAPPSGEVRVDKGRAHEDASSAREQNNEAAAQATSELARSLAALRASTSLLSNRGATLASSVAANLIRAEAWRSVCLLHASRVLHGDLTPSPTSVRTGQIVDQVLESVEPERRLRGATIVSRVGAGGRTLEVDEQLLVTALAAFVLGILALGDEDSAASLTVRAYEEGPDFIFGIEYEMTAPMDWPDRNPLTVAALRAVKSANAGVLVRSSDRGGEVRVTFTQPLGPRTIA